MAGSSGSTIRNRDAQRDALTGAFSRPYFVNLLGEECRFALDMGKPFSVCLIDIDQLRKVNADYGIVAGDELLADTAEAIRLTLDLPQWGNLRCLMGRYDGDCLILLFPGCRLKRAEEFAYRVRQRLSKPGQDGGRSTVSIAIAAFNGNDTIDDLLTRAEKTMCLAKQFGGDTVEVARTAELTRDLASVTRLPVAWRRPRKQRA
jgi:diguanylate cyclase (GGDEF)-like protein